MSAPTFLQTLQTEVTRMKTLRPDRDAEFSRAQMLIQQGMVTPSSDDPNTGYVWSSDGQTRYTVNGSCDCQAGQHGKQCKHLQSWKLYQFVAKKMTAQTPAPASAMPIAPLPEAPASVNLKVLIAGHEVMITLRDMDESTLMTRLGAFLKRGDVTPLPKPQPKSNWKPRQYQGR